MEGVEPNKLLSRYYDPPFTFSTKTYKKILKTPNVRKMPKNAVQVR